MARRDTSDTAVVDEVDVPDADTDTAPAEGTSETKSKEPARPPVPEGFVSPVGFAKELTKHLEARGATNSKGEAITVKNPIPPQQIYSMIRNSSKNNPFPVHEEGGRKNLIRLSEGLSWWDAKDERVAERKANAEAKATAKAQRQAAGEGEQAESTSEVVEAE
jgi:hypothetical protein